MDETLTITEVIETVEDWLMEEFPADMSPSEYRKAMEALDDLGMMDFEEMLDSYPLLNGKFVDDFGFSTNDEDFITRLDNVITNHISYLEESSENSYSNEDEW